MVDIALTLTVVGDSGPLPAPVPRHGTVTLRLAATDRSTGQPVEATGPAVIVRSPREDTTYSGTELVAVDTGVWTLALTLDLPGSWVARGTVAEPIPAATADLPLRALGSAADTPIPMPPAPEIVAAKQSADRSEQSAIDADAAATTATAAATVAQTSAGTAATDAATASSSATTALQAVSAASAAAAAATAAAADAQAIAGEIVRSQAEEAEIAFAITDDTGSAITLIRADGALELPAGTLAKEGGRLRLADRDSGAALELGEDGLTTGGQSIQPSSGESGYAWSVADEHGNVALGVRPDGTVRAAGIVAKMQGWDGTNAPNGESVLVSDDGTDAVRAGDGRVTIAGGMGVQTAEHEDYVWSVADERGNIAFGVRPDGTVRVPAIAAGGQTVQQVDLLGWIWAVADERGYIILGVREDGKFVAYGIESGGQPVDPTTFSAEEIAAADARALALSSQWSRQIDTTTQRITAKYNHFISYGQSLSTGWEGYPALSTTPPPGCYMWGQSVRPQSETAAQFAPQGDANLHPLVATVRGTTGTLLTPEQQAALPFDSSNQGETPLEGAVAFLRRAWNDWRAVEDDEDRLFLANAAGRGGRSVLELSYGAPWAAGQAVEAGDLRSNAGRLYQAATSGTTGAMAPVHTSGDASDGGVTWTHIDTYNFQRMLDLVPGAMAAVEAEEPGASYVIPAVIYIQGEEDYIQGTSIADYKARLKKLVADIREQVQIGIAGQTRPFAFITYQTGSTYTRAGILVGQAQLELCLEEPNWYLAAPNYPVTDKGGHLDSNGYRWLAQQFGKVLSRILIRGEMWRPLSPIEIQHRGREALILFHVPAPPLVFDMPYVINTATDYPQKGFVAEDASGTLPISEVEIVGDATVKLTFSRDPVGAVTVQYADRTVHNGNGCLRDSDPTVAESNYVYTEGSGQYESANIPALNGKPYPLHNWCVAFSMQATEA